MPDADAGIIHQHIHAVHQANRFGKRRFHFHQIRHVGDDRTREAPKFMANPLASLLVAIEHAYLRSLFEKSRSGSGANAARPAGDQNTFIF